MYQWNRILLVKHHVEIYFVKTLLWHNLSKFKDYYCGNLENKNTLDIEIRTQFSEELPKGVLPICVWQPLSLENLSDFIIWGGGRGHILRFFSIFWEIFDMFSWISANHFLLLLWRSQKNYMDCCPHFASSYLGLTFVHYLVFLVLKNSKYSHEVLHKFS